MQPICESHMVVDLIIHCSSFDHILYLVQQNHSYNFTIQDPIYSNQLEFWLFACLKKFLCSCSSFFTITTNHNRHTNHNYWFTITTITSQSQSQISQSQHHNTHNHNLLIDVLQRCCSELVCVVSLSDGLCSNVAWHHSLSTADHHRYLNYLL